MRRMRLLRQCALGALAAVAFAGASAAPSAAQAGRDPVAQQTVLPPPEAPFAGSIGTTPSDSHPSWLHPPTMPADAPNVLLIMTDDVGFAAASAFGGPVPTPHLEALAQHGLSYTQFHTTAICSATRAALLTGRNHHAVGTGMLADIPGGYPGYTGEIPRSAATIARVLRDNGYSTAMFGKHHNIAPWSTGAGPFDSWPTGLGFDYFYGFVSGDMNQWNPRLYRGTSLAEVQLPPGQTLDYELASDAIRWVHDEVAAAPDRPFFMYLAPGSTHAPHQAPMDWINRFRGQFDQGWDSLREQSFARQQAEGITPPGTDLTARPDAIPAWDALSADQRRVFSRMMEVYAGMLAYEDAQIGRLLDELQRMGELDNTLVIFIEGDNGASGEGGLTGGTYELGVITGDADPQSWLNQSLPDLGTDRTYETFPAGWAWALNTPFQWMKQVSSHLGGTRNGLVISWPRGIEDHGEIRRQFADVNDIAPTILEAVGVAAPTSVDGVAQQPIDGVSLAYSFDHADAPERHTTQYFEMAGTRAIYHDGWFANTVVQRPPWENAAGRNVTAAPQWELYNLRDDFSQAHNLAAEQPERLAALEQLWTQEAQRNHVFPIDTRPYVVRGAEGQAQYLHRRARYTYWGAGVSVAQASAPMLFGPWELTADITTRSARANGVLLATGSVFGGWSFYLKNGRPVAYAAANNRDDNQFRIEARSAVQSGSAHVRYQFTPDGPFPGAGGTMRIFIGESQVGEGQIGRTVVRPGGLGETFDTGRDTGQRVTDDYQGEGRFEGDISKIEITFPTAPR